MSVPIGLSVFSGLGGQTLPYLDYTADRFESLWLPDHLMTNEEGVMEGWTLLSYCLARYPDKTVGHQVLCNEFRNPALLAKMASTAQVLSGGRMVLGLGAGWHAGEALSYGLPFPPAEERFDRLIESVELIRLLWQGNPVTFDGEFYRLERAECLPAPEPQPPVMIGASGERHGLRAVAACADWWNHIFRSADEYQGKRESLRRHCERLGRDPGEIVHVLGTQILIAETEEDVRRLQEREDVRAVDRNGIAGTPEQILDELARAIDRGAGMVIAGFADSPDPSGAHLFTETVMERLTGV